MEDDRSKLIMIRCDSNTVISTGHAMRCLSIARGIIRLGYEVLFVVADDESYLFLEAQTINDNGVRIIRTNIKYNKLDDEVEMLKKLIIAQNPRAVLVDSYAVTENYLRNLDDICRVFYMDDIEMFDYPVNTVINYNLLADVKKYQKANSTLLGAKYTPIREQFRNTYYKVNDEVKNVMVSTGGTDSYHICRLILEDLFSEEKINKYNNINFHIILGKWNEDREDIYLLKKEYSNIIIYEDVKNMAEIMLNCDVAISASGTTLCELCAIGVPTIAFTIADNQIPQALSFDKIGAIKYIGDIRTSDNFYDLVDNNLQKLIINRSIREVYSNVMRNTIDAKGADRIAEELIK